MRTAARAPTSPGCCARCASLTDAQIQALTHGTIWVGPVGYTALGKIVPVPLSARLSARERDLLGALLLAHPGVASYEDLADSRWLAVGIEEARAEVRAHMGRLNDQILPYGVRAVPRTGHGYYLVEMR
jgi:DNA-binding response OmpR family regulator